MLDLATQKSLNRYARLAGFLYLFTYVVPITGWTIMGRLEVAGNFAETAHRIAGSELLYRFGLSCLLLNAVLCLILAFGLYRCVKPIDRNLALLGLLFRTVENVLSAAAAILSFVALKLYLEPGAQSTFSTGQLSVFTDLIAEANSVEFHADMIFLGAGSLLFFYLFLRSTYIPKLISAWGVFASVVFILVDFAALLWPRYGSDLEKGWLPMAMAEVVTGLWLMIRGVKVAGTELAPAQ